MQKFFRSYGLYLFIAVMIADLAGILAKYEPLHLFTKPLLMPVLMATVICSKLVSKGKWLIVAGLFFSFAGDVFLLFDGKYPVCFILGLASFLITHLLYIIYFLKVRPAATSLFKKYPLLLLPILAYIGGLLTLLIPNMGALLVPVVIYALVLGSMLLCSLHIFYRLNKQAAVFFVTGAVFFVVSDSLLAINKFYSALPLAGFLIMLTYCAAQFFIVKGVLKRD